MVPRYSYRSFITSCGINTCALLNGHEESRGQAVELNSRFSSCLLCKYTYSICIQQEKKHSHFCVKILKMEENFRGKKVLVTGAGAGIVLFLF